MTPTPQAISALLKRAGFKRSEQLSGYGGSGTGYRVTGTPGSGIVAVKHHFWSMSGRQDPGPHLGVRSGYRRVSSQVRPIRQGLLAKYAEAITTAGWNVEVGERALIVTAGKAEQ